MIVLSGALVLVALVLLLFGAFDRNLPYVYASIGVSLLSLLLIVVGVLQRRGELTGDGQDELTAVTDASDEQVPALVGATSEHEQRDGAQRTAELAAPVLPAERPASRRVAPVEREPEPSSDADEEPSDDLSDDPADLHDDLHDEEPEDLDEDEADDDLDEGSGVTVLVVSGRPRYHLEGCRVLRGKEPQALDRDDARTHGFSPCGVCKPDADEAAAPVEPAPQPEDSEVSFTETIFGGPLFADRPVQEADEPAPEALPDRPVQPVLLDVEPAADRPATEPDADGPAELRGDDPADADDTTSDEQAGARAEDDEPLTRQDDDAVVPRLQGDDPADEAEPATQVLDEPTPPAPGAAPGLAAPDEDGIAEPVVEPVAAEDVSAAGAAAPVDEPAEPTAGLEVAPPKRRRRTPATAAPEAAAPDSTADLSAAPVEPAAPTSASGAEPATRTAPSRRAPAKKAPATKAPARGAPARKAPVKKAPDKTAPAKAAPAKAAATAAPAVEPPAAPQVKRPLVRAVRADALRLGAPATGVSTTRVSARAAAPVASSSVVVVPDRERYHRPECRFVRGVAGATTLAKASATRQGYVACGVCKP